MKSLAYSLISVLLFCSLANAQSADDWIRVETDDARFSIEIPAKHKYFFNSDGFIVSDDMKDYWLKNMNLVTAFRDGSLMCLEIYDGEQAALDRLYGQDKGQERWDKSPEIKIGDVRLRELRRKHDGVYAVSRYFKLGNSFFILTAASRDGETPEITRFLNSMKLGAQDAKAIKLRSLKPADIAIEIQQDPQPQNTKPKTPVKPPDGTKPLVLIRTAAPSFVNSARRNSTTGTVRIRATFAEDGFTSRMRIVKQLPDGLLRQSIFALMRMRFLPVEKEGKAVSSTRSVIFSFNIL